MSSASQNLEQAASAEPSTTHQDRPQVLKRAASPEPQFPNQSKRQKLQERDNTNEGATSNLAHGHGPDLRLEQSPDNAADRAGSKVPEDDSDDGEAEDHSQFPENDPEHHSGETLDDEADREDIGESQDDSDDGEAEKPPQAPAKKVDMRSNWMKVVNRFCTHGNNTGFFSEELRKKGHNSRPRMLPDERNRLMEDLDERSDTSKPHDQPNIGLDFMSEFSTIVDSPKDASTFLGIDLQSLKISPESALRLRIDQVQNIAYMVKKAESILKGCVNANDYGTGKTIEALASVFLLAQRREACPDFGAHKAVLILCTHQALRGWQEAHAKYFSGLLSLHICSKSLPPGEHSQLIDPPKASALAKFLSTLTPSDPQTSRTLILCTYGELSSTEFLVERNSEDAQEKELSLRGSKLTEEALEALRVAQKPELYDLNFKPAIIGTLIADDAHEIKHPRSRKAQTAYLLDADIHFLLTANPVDNKISDFRGLLFALYKSKTWQINWPEGAKLGGVLKMFEDDFDPFKIKNSVNFVPHDASPEYIQALRNGQHLWRLNPHAYRWLGHQMKFGPEFSRRVLASIFRLCLLRRGVVSVASIPSGGSLTISGILAMPPISIGTIEVSKGPEELAYDDMASRGFNHIFRMGGKNSAAGAARVINDNETPLASFDNFYDTILSHITADLGLADVLRNRWSPDAPASRNTLPDIDYLIRNNTDSGMSFYYSMTRRDTDPVEPPADRASMVRHIVRRSPKLRWLLVKLEEFKQRGDKVVVYCVHPLTQWLVEGVCSMAEFNFLSLKSKPKHGEETRATVIDEFNNPGKQHDFLLSTMRVLGHGVDLHADCHNMIIFELPGSIPSMLSAIGRIRRVGQTKPQEISILMMKKSYDDYTLYRQSRKHAISILAYGVLGERLDKLAKHVDYLIDGRRRILLKEFSKFYRMLFFQRIKRDMPIQQVVKLLAAGELLRQHLGAQFNTSYIPWHCRRRILFGFQEIELVDFAGAKMAFNTELGELILQLVAQFPTNGSKFAGAEDLAALLKD